MTTTSENFLTWANKPENIKAAQVRKLAMLAAATTAGMVWNEYAFFYAVGVAYIISIPLGLLLSLLRHQMDKR